MNQIDFEETFTGLMNLIRNGRRCCLIHWTIHWRTSKVQKKIHRLKSIFSRKPTEMVDHFVVKLPVDMNNTRCVLLLNWIEVDELILSHDLHYDHSFPFLIHIQQINNLHVNITINVDLECYIDHICLSNQTISQDRSTLSSSMNNTKTSYLHCIDIIILFDCSNRCNMRTRTLMICHFLKIPFSIVNLLEDENKDELILNAFAILPTYSFSPLVLSSLHLHLDWFISFLFEKSQKKTNSDLSSLIFSSVDTDGLILTSRLEKRRKWLKSGIGRERFRVFLVFMLDRKRSNRFKIY